MTSNTISGRVVEKETGFGIPSLLVVVFDIDPNTRPEEEIVATPGAPATATATQLVAMGDRLGSVLTGSDGAFQLSYDDADYRVRNPDEQRPDLMLLVTGPEDAEGDQAPDRILAATSVRQNAGRIEQYSIRLTAGQLTAAFGRIPSSTASGRSGRAAPSGCGA